MNRKILIADDSLNTRGILRFMLASQGFEVIEATGGEVALEKARSQSPDIIVLDGLMPGMSGFEACRDLKTDPRTSGIPVILLSAAPQMDAARDWEKESPADRFMAKPFRIHDLIASIESLLGMASPGETVLRQRAALDPGPQGTVIRHLKNPT